MGTGIGVTPTQTEDSKVNKPVRMRGSKENSVKTALGIVLISAVLGLAGCQTTPPPQAAPAAQGAPGPAGPQGDPGQVGQQGQTGDTGLTGDPGHRGDRGHTGDTGLTGDKGYTGNTGEKVDTGDRGKAAPCSAGQHRHTNPDTGRVDCVAD
jgi:hypothetical protein